MLYGVVVPLPEVLFVLEFGVGVDDDEDDEDELPELLPLTALSVPPVELAANVMLPPLAVMTPKERSNSNTTESRSPINSTPSDVTRGIQ